MSVWPKSSLGSLVDLRLSSVDKKTSPVERSVRLCNYTDVYKNSFIHGRLDFMDATATDREIANCALYAGDVVITKDSEKHDDIGVPALVRENVPDLVCGYHLAILRPASSDIDGSYLYYALNTRGVQQQFHACANGVTRFGLRKADIALVQIPRPPISEQRAIARVLCALDDKVEANRRMNATLEGMAQAAFKDWFVDFGPVRAKAAGCARYLPDPLWSLFPDRLVDSEAGEIPEGWEVGCLGAVAAVSRRGADPVNLDDETPYIGLEHMPRRSIALTDWGRVGKVTSNKTVFGKGDILFGKLRPYFHKVGIAPTNGVCSTDILVIVPKAAEWAAFVTASVSSVRFVDHADRTSTGTKMPRTSWKTMSGYRLCLPETSVVRAFQDAVQPALERIVVNVHESRALAGLRDALLPRLVSGKLRVPGIE